MRRSMEASLRSAVSRHPDMQELGAQVVQGPQVELLLPLLVVDAGLDLQLTELGAKVQEPVLEPGRAVLEEALEHRVAAHRDPLHDVGIGHRVREHARRRGALVPETDHDHVGDLDRLRLEILVQPLRGRGVVQLPVLLRREQLGPLDVRELGHLVLDVRHGAVHHRVRAQDLDLGVHLLLESEVGGLLPLE